MPDEERTHIPVTHTGSLPRPDDLAKMLLAQVGGATVEGFEARAERAIDDVVEEQVRVGVDVVNDGEQGKPSYVSYVRSRLSGFGGEARPFGTPDIAAHPDFAERLLALVKDLPFAQPACNGEVRRIDHEAVKVDIRNLKEAAQRAGATRLFMTAASPGLITIFFEDQHYHNRDAYLAALVDALREEYEEIAAAGITVQLDCPDIGAGSSTLATRGERRKYVAEALEAIDAATSAIPPEQLRMHVCWGNYDGPHDRDSELVEFIDLLLAARPAGYVIEAANPRHAHEWEVFKDISLPEGKYLVPGVIDSTNNYVEHPRAVAQRLVNYGRLVGRERIMAGTDCGFGTFVGQANTVTSVVWDKFRSLSEGARIAWGELA